MATVEAVVYDRTLGAPAMRATQDETKRFARLFLYELWNRVAEPELSEYSYGFRVHWWSRTKMQRAFELCCEEYSEFLRQNPNNRWRLWPITTLLNGKSAIEFFEDGLFDLIRDGVVHAQGDICWFDPDLGYSFYNGIPNNYNLERWANSYSKMIMKATVLLCWGKDGEVSDSIKGWLNYGPYWN